MKPVIICGGVGSKMWPMSRGATPKHFLPLLNGKSLFQINYEVLRKKFSAQDIFLQTNELQAKIAKAQEPEIPDENIFVEPEMRNQGPATGFAAAMLAQKFPDETFILVQADVFRKPDDNFLKMIEVIDGLARSSGKYITGGFKPETIVKGVDYLIKGDLVESRDGVNVYKVAGYIDRSEEAKIQQYLGTDKLLLHANHTTMKVTDLINMYAKYRPDWSEPLKAIMAGADKVSEYAKMPKGAIEEITRQVYESDGALVVELPFEWIDFGTWESVANYLEKENLYQSDMDTVEIDSVKNFVYKKDKKFVALVGVENLVVVDTGDALLITKRDQTGKVGQVFDKLKTDGRTELV
ncbi:MAG: sugar phosphate nucleotidyltransferase [Candidatus Moranbacteria bacterium]|nr:sugar phosphate nucleotidyltransferase [Candidatus Moranbacteria bacterium]